MHCSLLVTWLCNLLFIQVGTQVCNQYPCIHSGRDPGMYSVIYPDMFKQGPMYAAYMYQAGTL